MNKSYNSEIAIRARDRFVTRFVSLMNKKVDYAIETTLFSLIYMGLPTLFVFLLLPLHAFGVISDLVLCSFAFLLTLYTFITYVVLIVNHTRATSMCIMQVFEENPTMRQVLYQSSGAQWADADAHYA